MFFVMDFEQAIIMSPSCLYKDLKHLLRAKLIEKVQGSISEKYGYIIVVIKVDDARTGKILDTSGDVLFNMKYRAVVMKPVVGEVVDGVSEKIDRYGIHVSVGPLKVFISNTQFPPGFEYSEQTNNYISKILNDKLSINSEVRFRIQGVQYENNEFHPTGTMNENYLGPLK
jgi:DNA-directed RNA polymerase subunit E'/Rpb7